MSRYLYPIIALIWVTGCSGIQKSALNSRLNELEAQFNHHVGLSLYDPVKDKMLYEYNGTAYFTPASNIKILTFYTSLKSLSDSLTTFYYKEKGDSLILWPAGDPTLLNPEFPASPIPDFLSTSVKDVYISFANANVERYGPGWAWEDFTYYFSIERSALPVYGNYFTIESKDDSLSISVPHFKQTLWLADSLPRVRFRRKPFSNDVIYNPGIISRNTSAHIPFVTSNHLAVKLLSNAINKPVYTIDFPYDTTALPLKSIPLDTAYKKMMHESNNFVAEQLLLQCAATILDTLDQRKMIEYALHNYLNFLPQEPRWVDGSGLSRYNLITPNSLIALWDRIYDEFDTSEIFPLLATGGKYGTLRNYYVANPPYIFGKTGTLNNNHNLSGYLITKKGKVLIFSFMNNNYPTGSTPVKKRMEEILWEIHLNN